MEPPQSLAISQSFCLFTLALLAGCQQKPAPVAPTRRPAPKPAPTIVVVEEDDDDSLEQHVQFDSAEFRPDDLRPKHDDGRLAEQGILAYESKRLKLYTDIDPDDARALPALVDQLYDALAEYFGPLPPDRKKTEFQMTGYLMRDEALFREAGLLDGAPTVVHGQHVQNRFWMRSQSTTYYTRHLLLHECTHCYMTFVPGVSAPQWYHEGMAERFGTHRESPDGRVEFCILPESAEEVPDWGRISVIRTEFAEGRGLTMAGVQQLPPGAYQQPRAYAWAWAFCHFLDHHSRTGEAFRQLVHHLRNGQFDTEFKEIIDQPELPLEWNLFVQSLQYGYDSAQAEIAFSAEPNRSEAQTQRHTVDAQRGWQDSGLILEAGKKYRLVATGKFALASEPKPWLSEPQGITFTYFDGEPLGKLVACIVPEELPDERELKPIPVIPIGRDRTLTADRAGRLLLRVNDAWNSLHDNSGIVDVIIERVE